MPWLHLIFDAWEDYKQTREREAAERETLDAQEREAMRVFEAAATNDDTGDDDGHGKKNKKKHKHKDRK